MDYSVCPATAFLFFKMNKLVRQSPELSLARILANCSVLETDVQEKEKGVLRAMLQNWLNTRYTGANNS
jgi:hypothetical protein